MTTEFEKLIIGILLSPGESHKEIVSQLTPSHFEDEICKEAFFYIKKISDDEKKPDSMNLLAYYKKSHQFDLSKYKNWISYCNLVCFTENISEIIETLQNSFISRSIQKIYYEVGIGLYDSKPGKDVAEEMIKKLTSLLESDSEPQQVIEMEELSKSERESYYLRSELAKSGKTSGLPTGISAINKFTGGWQSEFIVIGARPSMGKTALALFFAVNMKEPGIYFNLEMSQSQLAQRLIIQKSNGGVDSSQLRDGTLDQDGLMNFERSIGEVEKLPFMVYDKAACGVNEAIRTIKRQVRLNRCKWVIIDYLQLMTLEGFKGGNREAEVSQISRSLKKAQKDLGIPFIVLAQLNRECEKTSDKKPMLSHLRESGSIEQDADTCAFIYRPAYYDLTNDETNQPYTNEIYLLFEKHRQGATGSVGFRHNITMTNFYGMHEQEPLHQYKPLQPLTSFYEVDPDNLEY